MSQPKYTMSDDDDSFHATDPLDLIHDILETDRSFYDIIRLLDSGSRNLVVAAHMRNMSALIGLLRIRMVAPPQATRMIVNFPVNGNFFDDVPVIPNTQQIIAAVEQNVPVTDTQCSICQESIQLATRIRHCRHCFHPQCIAQWFSMNPRCPMCRHDIRDLHPPGVEPPNEDSRMHPDEES